MLFVLYLLLLTSNRKMIAQEMQKIDGLLDQKIQYVQLLLQNKKNLDYSLINNDLVYLYNEMLTLSYSLKLWLLNGLSTITNYEEEILKVVKDQLENILCKIDQDESSKCKKRIKMRCILPYQSLSQAV